MLPAPRHHPTRSPVRRGLIGGSVLAAALVAAGCSSSSSGSTGTAGTTAGTTAGSVVPVSSAVPGMAAAGTVASSSAVAAAPTNDDALHPFDGTWSKRFAPVACAIDDGVSTTTAAPGATTLWDLAPNCALPKQDGPKATFYWASSLTIDGSTITVEFPTNPSCTGAMHANGTTADGDTAVYIDHVTCNGRPAPDVSTRLRVDGDVLVADGERIPRKGAKDPAGSGPSTTGFTRVAPAIS